LKEKLIRLRDVSTEENFVAIGVTITAIDGIQQGGHSAIFLCLEKTLYIFHFFPENVIFQEAQQDAAYNYYYLKKLDYFSDDETELIMFKSYCERIKEKSNLKFGFVFGGSFYDPLTGEYFSDSLTLPELSTCVGFCINVLTGWIFEIEKYLEFDDWETITLEHPGFRNVFERVRERYPTLNEEEYNAKHKRIHPNELTISSYFSVENMPIRKKMIDELHAQFLSILSELDV
jgi:hypothetical protein